MTVEIAIPFQGHVGRASTNAVDDVSLRECAARARLASRAAAISGDGRFPGFDPDHDAVLRMGVTHTPEPRILDRFALDGYDLVLAGHTHGGQVRIPLVGAVVTNCGLDRSRAGGVSRWGSHTMLNVSAGLGTSPYMPMRFCCRPEATLLTLVPQTA